jgi:O-antigen/teichoic acid export membrane protein
MPPIDDEATNPGLDGTLASGVAWYAAMRWVAQAAAWVSTILVARLLSVADVGIVGIASLFVAFSTYITENGLARVLVVQRIREERLVRQLHGACIAAGTTASLLLALASPLIARFYRDERLVLLLSVLSVAFLLGGLNAVPNARLQQRLVYRQLATNDLVRSLAQTATVLGLALAGARYWAPAAGILVAGVVSVLLSARLAWVRPAWPTWRELATPVRYAGHLIAGSLLWYAYSNADFAVVGRALDVTALGLYQFAWNIAQLPGEKITNVLQAVAGPLFGSVGDDRVALRRYVLVVTESLAFVVLPVLVGFALVAGDAIPLVFGAKWRDSVRPLQILVLYALSQNLMVLLNLALASVGLARLGSMTGLLFIAVLPPAFWIAARSGGIAAVAMVWVLFQPVMFGIPLWHARRAFALGFRDYAAALAGPVVASSVMALGVWGVSRSLVSSPGVARLSAMVGTGALLYAAVALGFFRGRLLVLRDVWLVSRVGRPA